ncbi:hypothetical protein HK100_003451 [Physocladia obscura]|uniref:Cytochrome b5 heme-binding domain-containing protein n=1 Tax=Physocladia obscura TaxID=109957 RepID=A0AAD5SUA2_9FUNG|nr:hypothetical protein HK100_003451 [Physocladia obscura]
MAQVRELAQAGRIVVVFHSKVYDLTAWARFHPGGDLAVMHMNGILLLILPVLIPIHHPFSIHPVTNYITNWLLNTTCKDATDAIIAYHPDWVIDKKIPHFCVGELASTERTVSPKISQAYRALDLKIRDMGLYQTNYNFYIREVCKFAALWVAAIYLILRYPTFYGVLASSVCCAILWWQAAFVVHDAGHSGITHDSWTDMVMGISLANFFGGLSVGWWKKNHNVHHIVTNDVEDDPDIQHMPFMAVTSRLMNNIYSTYYKRVMDFDAVAKIMIPVQHYTFYILLALGRFNLYVNSIAHLTSKDRVPHRFLELTGITVFWIWYLSLLSTLRATPSLIVMHILVSHMLTCILHVQITLSHFGMDTSDVENETFAEMAFRTTMDVDCPRWFDWFHGGLQFQVAHHLFPRVPRHNLRTLRPLISTFAKEHGLTYHNYEFIHGNWIVVRQLAKVAQEVSSALHKEN